MNLITYNVTHTDKDGHTVNETSYTIFDKKQLQTDFDTFVLQSKDGDEIEYYKRDEKYFYPAMMVVYNIEGKWFTITAKGEHEFRKEYQPNTK